MLPESFPEVARMFPGCEDTHTHEITKKSNQNILEMAKKVIPSAFDMGVINVVEYLCSVLTALKPEYEDFRHKNDILATLGIQKEKWHEIVNHQRHVSTKPQRQAEIVGILRMVFKVDPNYIYNYGTWQKMFLENIVVSEKPPDVVSGYSARELRASLLLQKEEIKKLRDELAETKDQLQLWKSLAQLLQQQGAPVTMAAEPESAYIAQSSPSNPAKNPAKKPGTRSPK
jgi:hypothetical protein